MVPRGRKKRWQRLIKWNPDASNPDILKRGQGLDTQIAATGLPRTAGCRERASMLAVRASESIHGKFAMEKRQWSIRALY